MFVWEISKNLNDWNACKWRKLCKSYFIWLLKDFKITIMIVFDNDSLQKQTSVCCAVWSIDWFCSITSKSKFVYNGRPVSIESSLVGGGVASNYVWGLFCCRQETTPKQVKFMRCWSQQSDSGSSIKYVFRSLLQVETVRGAGGCIDLITVGCFVVEGDG